MTPRVIKTKAVSPGTTMMIGAIALLVMVVLGFVVGYLTGGGTGSCTP